MQGEHSLGRVEAKSLKLHVDGPLGSDVDNQTLAQDAAGPSTPTIMAIGPQQDLDTRPVVAQRRDQAAQPEHDLSPARPARRAQEGGDHTALAVEDHDRLEAV